jgi:hypothetical protein
MGRSSKYALEFSAALIFDSASEHHTMQYDTLSLTRGPVLLALAALVISGCAGRQEMPEVQGPTRNETIHALTESMELLTINAGQPTRVLQRKTVTGLNAGDRLIGIDYRVARGVLYAVSLAGRVYTLDVSTGALKAVSAGPLVPPLSGVAFGVDFNPAADRIRVVSDTGQNLRLHPDTGAVAAVDPATTYAPGDAQAGLLPDLVAAGYTYNKNDDKLTTNYVIDRRAGTLVMQGSLEGAQPLISPNTGQLKTIGTLGVGAFSDASMDVADVSGVAYAAIRVNASRTTRLYQVNLTSGKADFIGTLANGAALVGLAVEP